MELIAEVQEKSMKLFSSTYLKVLMAGHGKEKTLVFIV